MIRFIIFFLFPIAVFAEVTNTSQASEILSTFNSAASSWHTAFVPIATNLFAALVTIGFLLNLILLGIENGTIPDFSAVMGLFTKQILVIGFFLALIQHSEWISAIPESFSKTANIANGTTVVDPDSVFQNGIQLLTNLWDGISIKNPANSIALIFCGIIIIFCFAKMSANLLMTIIKTYVIAAIAPFAFALSALPSMGFIPFQPLIAMFKVGLELMLIKLFIALALNKMQYFAANVGTDNLSIIVIAGTAIMLYSVIEMIPEIVESIMFGTLARNTNPINQAIDMTKNIASGTLKGGGASNSIVSGISKVSSSIGGKVTKDVDVKPPS